jgi:hypothetical protein
MQSARLGDGSSGRLDVRDNSPTNNEETKRTEGADDDQTRDSLKLILNMIVDDVWKNYDSYTLQKRVMD